MKDTSKKIDENIDQHEIIFVNIQIYLKVSSRSQKHLFSFYWQTKGEEKVLILNWIFKLLFGFLFQEFAEIEYSNSIF